MLAQIVRGCFVGCLLLLSAAAVSQTATLQTGASPAAVPQKSGDSSLKVVSTPAGHLQVHIGEPSTLNKVFKAICTEQKLECTGSESLAAYPVPKMESEGTLREVVENLLQGTGVNYRYTKATDRTKATLVLLGHAPQGNNAALPARGNQENTIPTPLHSMPAPMSDSGNSGATESAPPADSGPSETAPHL